MSFSSTARFFFFPCLPPSLKGALGPRTGGAPRRSASAFAARIAFSRFRASSSLTASFSRASLLRTCSMTSSPTELMWLFTSTESDFRIWTSASLDIPMSLATSYTRRFLAGISPRFLVLVLVLVFLFVLFLFRFRLGFLGQDHALRRSRTQLFGVALLHGGFLGREVLLRLDATGPLQLLDVDARAALQILLPVPLALRDQVDLPAGELGREPRVLAALPDGQRQLVVRHRDQDFLVLVHDLRLEHLRRRQRARHED